MSNTNDGGPAFPYSINVSPRAGDYAVAESAPGMSLRDYFAGQALAGLLANSSLSEDDVRAEDWCSLSYRYADAMLAARQAVRS